MSDSQAKRTMPRMLISLLITLAIGAVWFYISLPAINLHNTSFYSFVFVLLLVYILVSMIVLGVDTGKQEIHLRDYLSFAKSQCKVVVVVVIALAALFVVGQILSAPIFRAGSYHELLDVETGNFTEDIEPVSYDEIPMLDEASAMVLGDRKLGELADMVSQFDVSEDYAQINYQGRPVRVAPLEYGDFFKWFLNTREGLPAYITVDMVTQEANVVRLSDLGLGGMRYSPSEYFNRDLNRFLRFHYPTYMFSDPHLEINDEGEPFWICPRETRTIGLFGGTDIIGAVMLNATTGEHVYYDVEDIPSWVDRVYTASLIIQQYDYYGTYVNGFINSIIGQKDVTVTTENFNYLAMDDDVYMYTGITSASSDQSNIGFLLSNQRTKETTYYPAPGAIETSAQRSAEGVVQDLGYTATFPLLLNIGGQPTYFMSLKDSSQLVKMYAMVNVAQYQIVAQGETVAACESDYIAQLQQRNIPVDSESAGELLENTNLEGTIAEIRTAVLEGTSWYYIRLDGADTFYAISASSDRNVVTLNVGDSVTVQVSPGDADQPIVDAVSITTGGAKPDPVPSESTEDTQTSATPEDTGQTEEN